MICPLKFNSAINGPCLCEQAECEWWDDKSNYNFETKTYTGQCCIKTLSQLKVSGGINTHTY